MGGLSVHAEAQICNSVTTSEIRSRTIPAKRIRDDAAHAAGSTPVLGSQDNGLLVSCCPCKRSRHCRSNGGHCLI